ncbi:MAG: GNAT family N-acetyltransferase [Polaribacter sp.]|nr:GNAT family N-acetyltransferase [Polaribacter sp.]MDG1812208.1 GNAT family N-acetyltransferase [Polaribacter sp.]MDG1993754.1 GNAT family N-acetyltransferase [Polaribacter sp.]
MKNKIEILVSPEISLKEIGFKDISKLQKLMFEIYPPVYAHLWPDDGEMYLKKIYAEENIKKELKEQNSNYYFILNKTIEVGILRVLTNEPIEKLKKEYAIKLQRIYLNPSIQRKGFGEKIIRWIETTFCKKEHSYLWLEAMDSQEKAIQFYSKMGFKVAGSFKLESDLMFERFRGMVRMIKPL